MAGRVRKFRVRQKKGLMAARGRGFIIVQMAKTNRWRLGAELGVFKGDNMLHILECCPDLYMIGVDMWTHQPGKDQERGGQTYQRYNMDQIYEEALTRLEPFHPRVTIYREDTAKAAGLFDDETFDFIFVDGDHTYQGVKSDVVSWVPKVKKQGWILGHDYNRKYHPDVVQVVKESFESYYLEKDDVWMAPKEAYIG